MIESEFLHEPLDLLDLLFIGIGYWVGGILHKFYRTWRDTK